MSRFAFCFLLAALLLSLPAVSAVQDLVITQPSANETLLAEERDFYVYGIFTGTVITPGDIRIELYPGDTVAGTPVRVIQSRVDPVTGITNESVLNQTYCTVTGSCTRKNSAMIPDLMELPGGILNPGNKVVVTQRYYLGMILGGVTKGFDTNYTDSTGAPLADLTTGNYTIEVTGLSGVFSGKIVNKTISLNRTSAILGTFRPDSNKAALTQYSIVHDRRIYFDWFPGYFTDPDNSSIWWEAPKRWTPNNGIEVVNDLTGTLTDTPTVANNSMFIYNLNSGSATYGVELAAILKFSLVDSPNTTFLYHNIGEPQITYNDISSGVRTLDGIQTPFASNQRLVLYRAEIVSPGGTSAENLYDPNDATTQKTLNLNPGGGVTVPQGKEFVVYGVTKPIASAVTATTTPYRYTINNRITRINCTITDAAGTLVRTGFHDVNLSRLYTAGSQTRFNSFWEFGIEVAELPSPATYTVNLAGVDASGTPVAQTETSFTVTMTRPDPAPIPDDNFNRGTSTAPQSVIIPGAHAGAVAVFAFSPASPSVPASVSSVSITPSREIGQTQCLVQPVTPGTALQLSGRAVAGYEQITVNWVNPDAIDHADIAFSVSRSWLDTHAVLPDQIVMMRYTDNQWVELPTRLDQSLADRYQYVTTTPGFSYFAITVKSPGAAAGAGNVTQAGTFTDLPGKTAEIPATEPATALNTGPATMLPAPVTIVTAAAPQSFSSGMEIFFPTQGITLVTIAAWVAVIVIIVICVILIRRWWIRKQNPALFRKYD
ncbi:MAG: PGF-pre-PGF domain-containing protein [Methanoregula sp.]